MISVIVPAFNAEKTIGRCLESILNQTYKDLEILVIDDCSKDRTVEICQEYAKSDARLKVIQLLENKGVSNARNVGLGSIKGEFFTFVDSDDYLCPDMYQKLIETGQAEAADIVFCKYNLIDWNGNKKENKDKRLDQFVKSKDISLFFAEQESVMGVVWRCLFRKEIFKDIRFDTNLSVAEDLMYLLDCIAVTDRLSLVNAYLYNYVLVQNYRKKYYENDYVSKIKLLGLATQKRLKKFGFKDLVKVEMFKIYYRATSAVLHFEKDYRAKMKEIEADEYFCAAGSKENYKAYKNTVPKKERLVGYLMMKRCYGIIKIIYSVFGRA